jgi:hypothetical protein
MILTDPDEFRKFHKLLTAERHGYRPWYFVLEKNDKDPETIRGSWKATKAKLTFDEAIKWLEKGHNIGIAATNMDPLVIIDIDDIEITPDSTMKATLSVRSRKRIGRHYFYFTDDAAAKTNIATEHDGEIRANWQYVVAPGSYVPGETEKMPDDQKEFAGKYTIENSISPSEISYKEFPKVFLEQVEKNKEIEKEKRQREREKRQHAKEQKNQPSQSKNNSAIFDLTIEDVVGAVPDQNRFPSLFHGSDTGKNTSVSDGLLQCWRHNVSHTPLSALAVMADFADCIDAGQSHATGGSGASCMDYNDGRTIFTIWKFAKKEGIIPQNDPIPPNAIRWYALENGLCKVSDIVDGWKLPPGVYVKAIRLFEAEEGMSSGRDIDSSNTAPSPPPERTPIQAAQGQYEILNYVQFRILSEQYPDLKAELFDGSGENPVYEIVGDDFITLAVNLKIIQPYTGDDGRAIILTSPELLQDFIQGVEVHKDGDDTVYFLTIRGEKLEFGINELTDVPTWRNKIIRCNLVISFDIKAHALRDAWSRMIADVLDSAKVEWEEEMSGTDLYSAVIIEQVQRLIEVDNRDAFKRNPSAKMKENGAMLVKTDTLRGIIEQKRIPYDLTKIRFMLASHLVRSTKRIRIKKDLISVWFFKLDEEVEKT